MRLPREITALVACIASAQTFEVASIKPSASGGNNVSITTGAGGLRAENVPVRTLIRMAYEIRDHQLSGAPLWADRDRFDIVARPNGRVPPGREGTPVLNAMIRSLLADRFGLRVHWESKEAPVYLLVVAKNGPKLAASGPDSKGPGFYIGDAAIEGTGAKIEDLTRVLADQLGRTVFDKTGLLGRYDFKLEFAPQSLQQNMPGKDGAAADSVTDRPSIFTALQNQLGLKLEASRGPVEIIVVDRIEKPTEN
jgi:uncharacterized protein (TIGR03435 family)